jgi:hypothetical protein
VHPPAAFDLSLADGRLAPLQLSGDFGAAGGAAGREEPAFWSRGGYTCARAWVRSHDGVRVPLTLTYREGLARDGTHPALLQVYGAYGQVRPAAAAQ